MTEPKNPQFIELHNEEMTVAVNPLGAELSSVRADGREWIWEGDPAVWQGRAPVMFPICGGLKGGVYHFEGKSYSLPKHGFARTSLFSVEAQSATAVTLLLTDNEETRTMYPFAFSLRITFALSGHRLDVTYTVSDEGTGPMYYSIGSHEAYECRPEGIEAYDVVFPQPETFGSYVLDGELLEHNTIPILENSTTLALKKEFFAVDALVFKDVRAREVKLCHRATGRRLTVRFPDADYLLLWTKPSGLYICIEPWSGIQEAVDNTDDLPHKEGICTLLPGQTREHRHSITFGE